MIQLLATVKGHAERVCPNRRLREFLTFVTVGGLATGVHYSVLIALVELAGVAPVVATTVGFLCGAAVSYTLNRHLTFDARPDVATSAAKFLAFGAVGLAMNAGIVAGLHAAHWHYLLAQAAATIIVLFWNYFSARTFVFRT